MVYDKEKEHRKRKKSLHEKYDQKVKMCKKLEDKKQVKGKLTDNEEIRLEKCKSEIASMRMWL